MKVDIQKAVLKSWSLLPKNIKLVLFTDSEYWKERAREANIDWSDAFEYLEDEPSLFPRLNRSGLPFLTSMTEWIQAHYRSRLYGYVNGDIILHSSIQDVLPRLFALSSPLLVVGRRYNTAVTASLLSHFTSLPSIDRFIASSVRFTEQFIPVAQDYFFFSPAVLNPLTWHFESACPCAAHNFACSPRCGPPSCGNQLGRCEELQINRDLAIRDSWGIDCYTRNLIQKLLKRSGVSDELVEVFIQQSLLPAVSILPREVAHDLR